MCLNQFGQQPENLFQGLINATSFVVEIAFNKPMQWRKAVVTRKISIYVIDFYITIQQYVM